MIIRASRRHSDKATRRQGDKATRRQGDKATRRRRCRVTQSAISAERAWGANRELTAPDGAKVNSRAAQAPGTR
ncbi:MAG: hypothetical protein WD229_12730, partial [Pirellulales bacterium]